MSIISSRVHPVYTARHPQLHLNRLAAKGGRPYVEARLWRAPNETDTQWEGDAEEQIVGRKERTCCVNDAGRIVSKIRQYLFKKPVERNGIDETFRDNCAGDGVSVDDFMAKVCDALTTGQWCWIQVDTTPAKYDSATGRPFAQTLADKPTVFWRLWESCDVPDWCIEEDGTLRWIIVRTHMADNSNPFVNPSVIEVSTLFRLDPFDGKVYKTEETNVPVAFPLAREEEIVGLDRLPFICVGTPSADAWWFDDVENIQAQVMNYDSMHNETLTDAVYPQLVVPMSLLNTLETSLNVETLSSKKLITLQRELIKGRKNPFYEASEDKGTTRYIQPASGDLTMLTTEQDRKRKLLFDMSGMALFNRETNQVQTAESKAFDQLDTNATLGNRALILQRAERFAVRLSCYFDPSFAAYEPAYNMKFDVVDVSAMSQTITLVGQMPKVTPTMRRMVLKAGVRLVLEVGGCTEGEYAKVLEEIENIPDGELEAANPFSVLDGLGVGDDEHGETAGNGGKAATVEEFVDEEWSEDDENWDESEHTEDENAEHQRRREAHERRVAEHAGKPA